MQEFQAKHPEVVLVALSVADDKRAIDKALGRQKLDTLRVAIGADWQGKFGLSDAIPVTVLLDGARVRVVHNGVLQDPFEMLEADLAALRGGSSAAKIN
jgi:hypothetical protein